MKVESADSSGNTSAVFPSHWNIISPDTYTQGDLLSKTSLTHTLLCLFLTADAHSEVVIKNALMHKKNACLAAQESMLLEQESS